MKRQKSFLALWATQAVSLLGSQLVQFAIVWWLTKTTGSGTTLALASLAALLPQVLLGPFAGALVDRWNRRMVMLVVDLAIALATLSLALLFWLEAASIWTIYALLVIRASGAAFHWPAMQASTTLMVERDARSWAKPVGNNPHDDRCSPVPGPADRGRLSQHIPGC